MDAELDEIDRWNTLRGELKKTYDYNAFWEQGIVLFNERLNRKFFNPVQDIIDQKKQEGEGFAIVTVQCALIEAFATFRTGEIFDLSSRNDPNAPSYKYWRSKKTFIEFLHTAEIFKEHFWQVAFNGNVVTDVPFSASDFYEKVRCGLMHEARTIGDWYINTSPKPPEMETIFIEQNGTKISLYRTILHFRLKKYLADYSQDLRTQNANKLRRFFARKLDHLFDIPADSNNFDWWVDP